MYLYISTIYGDSHLGFRERALGAESKDSMSGGGQAICNDMDGRTKRREAGFRAHFSRYRAAVCVKNSQRYTRSRTAASATIEDAL